MGTLENDIERVKALLDYAKQLTALSTGSILVVAAFVEKVFPAAHWKWLTALSIIGFVVSVLGSIVAHTIIIVSFPPRATKVPEWEEALGGLSIVFAWGGFLLGIVCLSIFTTKNLL